MKIGEINNKAEKRRKNQLDFVESGKDISVGSLDNFNLSLSELIKIDKNSKYVEKYIDGGFTSEVYKLNVDEKNYTLKKKRDLAKVLNVDGQTSFLNEVQRRCDFEELKKIDSEGYKGIVDTIYASYKNGIILSPWIDGDEIHKYTEKSLESIHKTIYNMEIGGIFECDFCHGNLLLKENDQVMLYDFGYAYKYNPLTEYNSDENEKPVMHGAERFETRTFMQHLMDIEEEVSIEKALELFKLEKKIALKYYKKKLDWLIDHNANLEIINWIKSFINLWSEGISSLNNLENLYKLESFRSYLIDVHDDVGGKCCNPDTLRKIEKVIEIIEENYLFVKDHNGLFWGDEKLSKDELLKTYKNYKELVLKYQAQDLTGYNQWLQRRKDGVIKNYN